MVRAALLVHVALLSSACATSGPTRCPLPAASHSAVSAAELRATGAGDLLEAVRRARPAFLRGRVAGFDGGPVVYVDGIRMGPAARLREVPLPDVSSVSHVAGLDATTRWGVGHGEGAVLVTTRGLPAPGPCETLAPGRREGA